MFVFNQPSRGPQSAASPKAKLLRRRLLTVRPPMLAATLAIGALCAAPANAENGAGDVNWSAYLGGLDSSQYSPLNEITPENVQQLDVAWTYHTGDASEDDLSQIQTNPLVIDGVVYGASPTIRFFALNAATGEEIWSFDPFEGQFEMNGM